MNSITIVLFTIIVFLIIILIISNRTNDEKYGDTEDFTTKEELTDLEVNDKNCSVRCNNAPMWWYPKQEYNKKDSETKMYLNRFSPELDELASVYNLWVI